MQLLVIEAKGKNGNCAEDRHNQQIGMNFFSTLKGGEFPHIPAN